MELSELVKEVGSHGVSDVVKSLQSGAHAVWQEIWNLGHANATARAKEDLEGKQKELDEAKAARSKLDGQLEQLKESQPDAAKIREQYDTEIKDLEAKHAKEVVGLKDDRAKSEVDREVSAFQSRLVSLGMDPDYAEVQAQKKADRFRFEDGKGVQIMQEGKEIPITAGEDKTPLDVLAEAVVAAVPARFINSKADKGTGHRTHQQGTGGAGGSVYDRIREDRKAEREKGGKDRLQPRDELSRRMNVSPTN